ncbi:protease modulator HflC [Alkalispirochaeta sphaeroplastigenens]|uniref:Protein HflC n=1 Tax=Alkalispirochaeta sphaeroplastigenens TaxID=1187066 RepID=A0A2S4K0Y6_9SPIO|nr:protease modulator HflC [Alkalispirochaeta sphaeroplastigenens]POR05432.1 protease modulator HflC [Alkalispirochaeta sphaeroplastigenens]
MKKISSILTVLLVAGIFLVILGPFYIVPEGRQALIIRFGQIVKVTQEAGLHLKTPVIDQVVPYSAKILSWDGEARRMPTSENQFIWVDTTARWVIQDPDLFYRAVTTMERAHSRLNDVIESAVRTVISGHSLEEAVRDSNVINKIVRSQPMPSQAELAAEDGDDRRLREITNLLAVVEDQPNISIGRQALSEVMLARANETAQELGIEIKDIVIRQIRYSADLTESVYERMVSERRQIAEAYRSYGEGRKQELLGQRDNERRSILSEAYERAETIRGEADAQAATVYTDAYRQDPEFFAFWRAIESYRKTMPQFRKTLSTDMDYFNFLYSEEG